MLQYNVNTKKDKMEQELTEQDRKLIDSVHNCSKFDVVIVGGGVAGLSAGIYAARDGFKTLILEGTVESSVDAPGGALLLTSEIENFPGFVQGEGAELIGIIRGQAETFGADIREERVQSIDAALEAGKMHTITTRDDDGEIHEYCARTIILATGAVARRLGIPGEDELYGQGVSTCATCDGFFFKEKKVAVVGGGDTAVEDALLLTRYAKEVTLIVRGSHLRASGPEARAVLEHPDITILWNSSVKSINPNQTQDAVDYAIVINSETGVETQIDIDGLFVAIGSDPATSFLKDSVILTDRDGYILVADGSTRVQGAIPGVFAAGDAVDRVYRQAITSAGQAVQAALEARAYLNAGVAATISQVTDRY
jgi:thioredoxin reductase (NADPH)